LVVNGGRSTVLTLPNTAWGNWQMAEYRTVLHRGWNSVRLTKWTWYAEIDAVDVYRDRPAPPPPALPSCAPTRYEAEDGVVTDAHVVADSTASHGAKVGGMDHPDSSVALTIDAKRAGVSTVAVRYGNGSLDNSGYPVASTDAVTVNGRPAGVITFRNTTWDNWQTATYRVRLRAGTNTLTFTKRTFYAELDAVDVC
ncbi:MAG: hypothetical protein M3070_00580, partial [Actinomycetota bacterium]|nr:hypothetical protein [Actinomycetota bacterium]